MGCQLLGGGTPGSKLEWELRRMIQEEEKKYYALEITSNEVEVLNKISPEQMRQAQLNDNYLLEVVCCVEMHNNTPSYARIRKLNSLIIRKYLLQFSYCSFLILFFYEKMGNFLLT